MNIAGWLAGWLRGERGADAALADTRWVVVDCETSGLDVGVDRLLSIGAVALRGGRIDLAESYHVVLRQQAASDAANIVIHGIGGASQRAGEDPASALQGFAAFAGEDPLAAFHAPFDRAMLERDMKRVLGKRWRRRWLDLAQLMPVLDRGRECRSLDDWLGAHAIVNAQRHDALGDAYATAQLLQVALALCARQRMRSAGDVLQAAAGARWLA